MTVTRNGWGGRAASEGGGTLEDAPEPSRHATDVVRVPRGIGLHPFIATPREADLEDCLSAKSERAADAHAGLQSVKAEIARSMAHLAQLTEYADSKRVHDLALVADLVRDEIVVAEAVVPIAAQQILVVDVGAAHCRLKIEGHRVPRIRVAQDESADEVDGAEALLRIQTDVHVPLRIEPPKGKRPTGQGLVEGIAHARRGREPVQGRVPWIRPG